jgi:hypothetical protein
MDRIAVTLLCLATITGVVTAQESIRVSSMEGMAPQARVQSTDYSRYNLKMGKVLVDAAVSVQAEFNHNVGLSETNEDSDIAIRPQLDLQATWQMTQLNRLNFGITLGYTKYLENDQLDTKSILLSPNSEISFDIFLGKVRLNIHDRFAILQNPVDDISLSQAARFERFLNSVGITLSWPVTAKVNLVAGYDHFTFRSITDDYEYLDRSEEQFSASIAYAPSDILDIGIDATAVSFDYDDNFNNDGFGYSVGPFIETRLSAFTKLRVAGGYQNLDFDSDRLNGDRSNFSGWYATVTVSNRLSDSFTHALHIGREARLGLSVNFLEYNYARYTASWRVNSRLSAAFDVYYEDSQESGGISEEADRWGLESHWPTDWGERSHYARRTRMWTKIRTYRFAVISRMFS